MDLDFSVKPVKIEEERDGEGNLFKTVTFEDLTTDINVNLKFIVNMKNNLKELSFSDPFPVVGIKNLDDKYLKSSKLVQSDDPVIRNLAKKLS